MTLEPLIVDPLITAMDDDLDIQPPACSLTIQINDDDDPVLPEPIGLDTNAPTLILD